MIIKLKATPGLKARSRDNKSLFLIFAFSNSDSFKFLFVSLITYQLMKGMQHATRFVQE